VPGWRRRRARAGVEIGEEAFVGAGGSSRAMSRHVPARQVGTVDDAQLLERWR
jgi:hypothetical protein